MSPQPHLQSSRSGLLLASITPLLPFILSLHPSSSSRHATEMPSKLGTHPPAYFPMALLNYPPRQPTTQPTNQPVN